MSTDPAEHLEAPADHLEPKVESVTGSNPSSTGPAGLAGDMGVSSERTGHAGEDPRGLDTGIAGTGSKGSAVSRTDGTLDTSPTEWDAVDVSQSDLHPTRDAELDDTSGQMANTPGPDRTVGEPHPNPIPDDKIRVKHEGTGGDGTSRAR